MDVRDYQTKIEIVVRTKNDTGFFTTDNVHFLDHTILDDATLERILCCIDNELKKIAEEK